MPVHRDNILDHELEQELYKTLPKRFRLAAFLLLIGIGIDIPWLDNNTLYILIIRCAMVVGPLLFSILIGYFQNRIVNELAIVTGVFGILFGMALLGDIEGNYLTGYVAAVYQILAFTAIFFPLSTRKFVILTFIVGLLWFLIFPLILTPAIDKRLFISHIIGYFTYSFMAIAANRLFLRMRKEHIMRLSLMREHTQTLEEAATKDGLTEIHNYRHFQDVLPFLIEQVRASQDTLSLCLVDLDDFKAKNDLYGHSGGNLILKHVAKSLKSVVRKNDGVFRIGGDEFTMVLPNVSASEAERIAQRLQEILNNDFYHLDMPQVNLGPIFCSIGIAELAPEHSNFITLVNDADSALYAAKAAGGNGIVLKPRKVN